MESTFIALSLLGAPIDKTTFNNPLIVTETPIVQIEPPKELTIEEKIAQNFYKCDTDTQWIRKDNAECKLKPRAYAIQANSTAPSGWYKRGQCTWYVSTRRQVGQWNDATDWKWQAIRDGYTVSKTPKAGAIAWKRGHVAYVESVNENGVVISEANYDYKGSIRTITVQASEYEYIY